MTTLTEATGTDDLALRDVVAHQNKTIATVAAAAKQAQARIAELEYDVRVKDGELATLRPAAAECAALREQVLLLTSRLRTAEGGGEDAMQAMMRAEQSAVAQVAAARQRAAALEEALVTADERYRQTARRLAVVVEQAAASNRRAEALMAVGTPPSGAALHALLARVSSQAAQLMAATELLSDTRDTADRQESVVQALRAENGALRQSVSKLVSCLATGPSCALVSSKLNE